MRYTTELVNEITTKYQEGMSVKDIALWLSSKVGSEVPERSVIAKLSSLGIYQRKQYLNKRGEVPTKKEEYIDRIAKLLDINVDLLESLEKVTKTALVMIETRIKTLKGE